MELIVVADDRSGALETAAAIADVIGRPVPVVVGRVPTDRQGINAVDVVDVASRHASADDASGLARRALSDVDRSSCRVAHKIDSTLRGNWAAELVAMSTAVDAPALVVAALPALARVCRGGVVYDHDRPVHHGPAGSDVRHAVGSSRPADALAAAGATPVVELGTRADITEWLAAPSGIAVADAAADDDLAFIGHAWAASDPSVVLAGTSAAIGFGAHGVVHRENGQDAPTPDHASIPAPVDGRPTVVACGSVHPMARRQIEYSSRQGGSARLHVSEIADAQAMAALADGHDVALVTQIPIADVSAPMAIAASAVLARGVHALLDSGSVGALVILGGDSAAAVLGRAEMRVAGAPCPGAALVDAEGFGLPVITRAGGFGTETGLADLLGALRAAR